jgi:hypothetical protein
VQFFSAASVNYFDDCKSIAKLQAATKSTMSDTRYKHTKNYTIPHLTGEYVVNKIVLVMQQMGCGEADASVYWRNAIHGGKCIRFPMEKVGRKDWY